MNSRKMTCSSPRWVRHERLDRATFLEDDRPGQAVQPHHRQQQHCASDQRVGEIDLPAAQSLPRPAMHNQRIRCEGQQLIKREEGDQVGRQGDTGGGRDAQAEEAEEAAAMRRVLQVANRVNRGAEPQDGGQGHEEDRVRIRAQRERDAGQELDGEGVRLAAVDAREQHGDQDQLHPCAEQVQPGPQPMALLLQEEDHQARHERAEQNAEEDGALEVHGTEPPITIGPTTGAPTRSSSAAQGDAKPSTTASRANARAVPSMTGGIGLGVLGSSTLVNA